jgi:hypothetical protein
MLAIHGLNPRPAMLAIHGLNPRPATLAIHGLNPRPAPAYDLFLVSDNRVLSIFHLRLPAVLCVRFHAPVAIKR